MKFPKTGNAILFGNGETTQHTEQLITNLYNQHKKLIIIDPSNKYEPIIKTLGGTYHKDTLNFSHTLVGIQPNNRNSFTQLLSLITPNFPYNILIIDQAHLFLDHSYPELIHLFKTSRKYNLQILLITDKTHPGFHTQILTINTATIVNL